MPDPGRPAWVAAACIGLELFPDPVVVLRAVRDDEGAVVDGTVLDLNASGAAELRTTREAILGASLVQAVPFADMVIEHLSLALTSPDPLVVDNVLVENVYDGFRMMLDVRAVATGDDTVLLTWRDVTAYADLLDSAVLAEHRQRLVAENASDVVLMRGTSGITTWVSPSVTAMLGWSVEQVEGTDILDLVHPDDRAGVRALRAAVARGEQPNGLLARFICRDGSDRWMTCVSVPMIEDGEVVGATVGLRDVDAQVRAQQAAELSQERYRLLAENASDVVYLRDRVGRVLWISPSIERVLGWPVEEMIGSDLVDLLHPDDRHFTSEARADLNTGVASIRFVGRVRHSDGSYRFMEVRGHPVVEDGVTTGAVVGLHDVHDQEVARAAAEESQRLYRLLAENSSDVVFLSNERTDLLWVSPSAKDTLGWTAEQLQGRRAVEFIHPDELENLRRDVTLSSDTNATVRVRYRWLRPDGSYRWLEAVGRPLPEQPGEDRRRIVSLRDVHEQVLAEEELNRRARYDDLTGLLNRGEILRLLEERLADRRARAGSLAVAFCDLDGLKRVNDSLGHVAGDRLIEAYAQRIRECVRGTDLVGRLGGDEILLMLDGITEISDVEPLLAEVVARVAQPVEMPADHDVPAISFATTLSVGVTLAREGDTTDSVYGRADAAMYEAKAAGGGRVVIA